MGNPLCAARVHVLGRAIGHRESEKHAVVEFVNIIEGQARIRIHEPVTVNEGGGVPAADDHRTDKDGKFIDEVRSEKGIDEFATSFDEEAFNSLILEGA